MTLECAICFALSALAFVGVVGLFVANRPALGMLRQASGVSQNDRHHFALTARERLFTFAVVIFGVALPVACVLFALWKL